MSTPDMNASDRVAAERRHVLAFAVAGGALLLLATWVALSFGRDAHGWTWASGTLLEELMPWRWPRILAALMAGGMLGGGGGAFFLLCREPKWRAGGVGGGVGDGIS
nr:hypothetical protein QS22_01780 [Salmonella enterica subsp. enterica serovar Brandenburg]